MSASADATKRSGAYAEGITRSLSAAAFVRPDRLGSLRNRLHAQVRKVITTITKRTPGESASGAHSPLDDEPQAPAIVIGEDYAVWVRRRVKGAARPVPVHSFDQNPVFDACDTAARHLRRRRTAIVAVIVAATCVAMSRALPPIWATATAALGIWGIFLADRFSAQRHLNRMLSGDLANGSAHEQVPALPYIRESRRSGPRDRFVGAGLQAWHPAIIGIDVEPAPEGQDDDEPSSTAPLPDLPESGPGEIAAAVIAALNQHNRPTRARKPLKHFEVPELHAHVTKRLQDPAPAHHPSHPIPRMQVVGIAAIAHGRWNTLNDEAWRGLDAVAAGHANPAAEVARRYIWARINAWNGNLIASVLVHFAYEGGFLRVTVRPHVMAPLNPAVASLTVRAPNTLKWMGVAGLQSIGDIGAGVVNLMRRGKKAGPELDPGNGPVSLREVYSLRWIDDMHMNDDARYYVQMMQRRVFDSTETFLRDHNVDIAQYREQSAAIYNFGVMNGGVISGSVQAAPFAGGATMS
ncbi:hypothetical protein LO772_15490 [Yinghuangia sp. ASG 101]|uniref:hypothetical protein n=1 Tax=Yinghuangia sp. ASG 101 TaxID=2896848 RepID=UPI001E36FA3E|nr:hypothetical protein [Yinghuangia sp. ASG 101]UGQ14846.1 hypothetical protein LO772_15490 [Yinghuangia sp. ASG 101]